MFFCDQAKMYHRSYVFLTGARYNSIFRFVLPTGKVYKRNEKKTWSQVIFSERAKFGNQIIQIIRVGRIN